MKNGRAFIAWSLILFGALFLAGNILHFDLGAVFWPLVLILLGITLIFRPEIVNPGEAVFAFAGDWTVDGDWDLKNNELRAFAMDLTIDLREIELPDEETVFRFSGFAGDIKVFAPEGIGLTLGTSTFVTETNINGEKTDHVFTGMNYESEGYQESRKKFRMEIYAFAVEIDIINI